MMLPIEPVLTRHATPEAGFTREHPVPCGHCIQVRTLHRSGVCQSCRTTADLAEHAHRRWEHEQDMQAFRMEVAARG